MAKIRMINTRFWIDDYVSHLDPIEKLLFLYFLTNPYTDICGIYEVPLKNVASDTGIDKEMVIKILNRFEKDGKVFYRNGWIGIKNFTKHQLNNPSVKRGIQIGIEKAPQNLTDLINSLSQTVTDSIQTPTDSFLKPRDSFTKPTDSDRLSHPNLNPNSNSNLNPNLNTKEKKPLNEVLVKRRETEKFKPNFLKK